MRRRRPLFQTGMPMSDWPARIVLVGAGKMGGALARGWLEGGLDPSSLFLIEPNPSEDIKAFATSNPRRPQRRDAGAAGRPCARNQAAKPRRGRPGDRAARRRANAHPFDPRRQDDRQSSGRAFPDRAAIVRAMPNTPASVGRGVTGAIASEMASDEHRRWTEKLLSAVGAFYWVADEQAIDAVTAISGGGPAYVFALTEALAAAAEKLGLPAELSMRLARGAVEGSGELMRREPATPPLGSSPQRHFARRDYGSRPGGFAERGRPRRPDGAGDRGGSGARRRNGRVGRNIRGGVCNPISCSNPNSWACYSHSSGPLKLKCFTGNGLVFQGLPSHNRHRVGERTARNRANFSPEQG